MIKKNRNRIQPWKKRRSEIAKILVAAGCDVIAVQEIGSKQVLLSLQKSINQQGGKVAYWGFVPGKDIYTGQQVGILSRWPLRQVRRFRRIPVSKHVLATVQWPAKTFHLVVAHLKAGRLESSKKQRRRQAQALQSASRNLVGPVIFAGDFNTKIRQDDESKNKTIDAFMLLDEQCEDSAKQHEATHVSKSIYDHVIACRGLTVSQSQVIKPLPLYRRRNRLSDHYLLVSEVSTL